MTYVEALAREVCKTHWPDAPGMLLGCESAVRDVLRAIAVLAESGGPKLIRRPDWDSAAQLWFDAAPAVPEE